MANIIKTFGGDTKPTKAKGLASKFGGKGAGLIEMAQLGIPVPPGFIIPTAWAGKYAADNNVVQDTLMPEIEKGMKWLEETLGYRPLVSVRSGAPVSMPGMMDTILNVGVTDSNLSTWVRRLGARTALDCYRRNIEMWSDVVMGSPVCTPELSTAAQGFDVDKLCETIDGYRAKPNVHLLCGSDTGHLKGCVEAVFKSWNNDRAKEYRKMNGISENMGTAVVIQAMVFGNSGPESGSGVCFTRNPANGANEVIGEFLINAQGEDVVAGTATPISLDQMATMAGNWGGVFGELLGHCEALEAHYKDMVDIEFTVQDGKLYILQSRKGKRTSQAALRIARDLVEEDMLPLKGLSKCISPKQLYDSMQPSLDPSFKVPADFVGLPAGGGVVSGKAVFSSEEAVKSLVPCILVTKETTPDDLKGMAAAAGILTQTGGVTSHAAVVARAMNTPCVTGCPDILKGISAGDMVSIDGATGRVWAIEVPTLAPEQDENLQWLMAAALEDWGGAVQADTYQGRPTVVSIADWMFDPDYSLEGGWVDSKINALVASVEGVEDDKRDELVLDLRLKTPATYVDDKEFWDMAGPSKSKGSDLAAIANAILMRAHDLRGVAVAGLSPVFGSPDDFKQAGFRVTVEAKTVEQLIKGDAVIVTADFVADVLGGPEVLDALKEKFDINLIPASDLEGRDVDSLVLGLLAS